MKFSIKLKIVALGAVLSLLVTTAAVIFANFEFRKRGQDNLVKGINNWLGNMDADFSDPNYGDDYLNTVSSVRSYILKQYEQYPDDAPEDMTIEEQKLFYKDRFRWLYAIEGFGMYPMTDEERDFRAEYQEFLFLLSDAKNATNAVSVYMAFIGDNDTLFYIGDEYSYKKVIRPDMHFPGSRIYNFSGQFAKKGDYYDCNFDGKMNRVLPVYNHDNIAAYVFVEYSFAEVNKDTDSMLRLETIVLAITSTLMILAYALGAHFLFLRNISKLTKSSSEFTNDLSSGKPLEKKDPNIKSHDEIFELSNSFIALEEGIIKYIDVIQQETKERERAIAELSVASNIQLGALPNNAYDDEKVAIRAFIKSAKEVGGDFYDYFYLDDNRLVVLVSDVSGKGIPAALFMMKSKELLKSAIRSHRHLKDAIKEVNSMLASNNKGLLFVTTFVGIIDFEKNKITYVNAGHEKPYIVSYKGVKKIDGESNFVLGGVDEFEYKEEETTFNKGDYLFLFTDGLSESINDKNEEFYYERIEEELDANKASSPANVIDSVNQKLEEFVGEKEQFDDVTIMVIKHRDNELHLSYDKKDYGIISDIIDRFNDYFCFINSESKAKCGIIVDELVNNIISYVKREDILIEIDFKLEKDDLVIVIKSNGEDYNPFANHKEKYLDEFHPEIKEGGFGLSIIKDLAKSYKYEYTDKKPTIIITLPAK